MDKKKWVKPQINEIKQNTRYILSGCARTTFYDGSAEDDPRFFCTTDADELLS